MAASSGGSASASSSSAPAPYKHQCFVKISDGPHRPGALLLEERTCLREPFHGLFVAPLKGTHLRHSQAGIAHWPAEVGSNDFLAKRALYDFDSIPSI